MSNDLSNDVIIIGAGIAGLSCALDLSQCTDCLNITVLEASNRLGGRICSIKTNDGTTLQLGAEYIHGTKGNDLYDYMIAKGLVSNKNLPSKRERADHLSCFPKELSFYDREKVMIAISKAESLLQNFQKELFALTDDEISKHKSVGAFMIHCFQQTLYAYKDDDLKYNTFKSVFMTWIGSERISSGVASVLDLDICGFKNWIELDGDPFLAVTDICENGFEDVINTMVQDIGEECIFFNNEVTGIDYVMVDDKQKIKVSCSNGKEYVANCAVLTVSLGVLKHFLTSDIFSFDLPAKKQSAVKKLSYGKLFKMFFKFKTPIDKKISYFYFYPSPSIHTFHEFDKEINLYAFERIASSDWWLSWNVGDEKFKLGDPVVYLNKQINKFADIYQEFPSNSVIDESIIVSDWFTDELFRGSYTYQSPGSNGQDISDLAEPVILGDSCLLFAGEATSINFFSSTHGAYISGKREAENIKSFLKLNS